MELVATQCAEKLLAPAEEVLMPSLNGADEKQRLVAAKCLGLMRGYGSRWANAPYWIDSVESVMTSDLVHPKTNRKSRSFRIAGKLDVRATEIGTGAKVLFDHKTTSDEIGDLNAPFWRILVIDGQLSHYMLLEWLHANRLDYGVWDVIRKPSISPKLLSKADAQAVICSRNYMGHDLSDEDMALFLTEPRETPLMYAARLEVDCASDRPDRYFQRRKIPRLESELLEYATELWGNAQDILIARRLNRWPRNSGACFTYNTPCGYLGICSGHDSADSDAWTQRSWVHPELPILAEGRGVDVLTNSRIKTFQTCRRKHQLRYEVGLEKVDEEEREALFFGDLMHKALEQFFLALQRQQKGVTQ